METRGELIDEILAKNSKIIVECLNRIDNSIKDEVWKIDLGIDDRWVIYNDCCFTLLGMQFERTFKYAGTDIEHLEIILEGFFKQIIENIKMKARE